jgi:hypothetical protein
MATFTDILNGWTDCDTCHESGSVEPAFSVPGMVHNGATAVPSHSRALCHACGAIQYVTLSWPAGSES